MTRAILWEMVPVFPGMFPAIMEVAPYSPMALAKVRIVPEAMPGPAVGMTTFQNMDVSLIPKVLPAFTRSGSTSSKAARAFLYMSGNAITMAAMTQPVQVCTTLMSKVLSKNMPKALLLENIRSRMKPATVGGSTKGMVNRPSTKALVPGFNLMTFLAVYIPKKKDMMVATIPVLRDMMRGLQSSSLSTSMMPSIAF